MSLASWIVRLELKMNRQPIACENMMDKRVARVLVLIFGEEKSVYKQTEAQSRGGDRGAGGI